MGLAFWDLVNTHGWIGESKNKAPCARADPRRLKMTNRISSDEDRLVADHESTKARVERDLNAEVELRAERDVHRDAKMIEGMAHDVKDRAVAEVQDAESLALRRKRLARTVQVIDFLFTVVYVLLGTRLALGMMAANSESGFVQLIRSLTDPFYSMFSNIVRSPVVEGGYTFAMPILVAIGAYGLLHWLVRSVAKLAAYRKSDL